MKNKYINLQYLLKKTVIHWPFYGMLNNMSFILKVDIIYLEVIE